MNWNQLKAILWLRWRLTRHQWSRGGGLGAVIAVIIATTAAVLGLAALVAGLLVGAIVLRNAPSTIVMAIWLGLTVVFVCFWLTGLVTELQRSETIDLPRLMHLPVQLGQIFVINYLASHFALSIVLLVPAMIGLAIGLAVSRTPMMLLMVPLALAMVFMITAWMYHLRGWLAVLMTNPRKRRTVVVVVTAVFVLLAQGPNLYFNVIRRSERRAGEARAERAAREERMPEDLDRLMQMAAVVPPLWVPLGARNLAEGKPWPAAAGFLGMFAIGALGLQRAYRSTLRFYQGETGGRAGARGVKTRGAAAGRAPDATAAHTVAATTAARRAGPSFLERQILGVPGPAAVVALATLRSLLRAPEVKMQWGSSFLVPLVVGGGLLLRRGDGFSSVGAPFIVTGVVVVSLFMLVGFAANQFGIDRDGFRAFVLSPIDRRLILLGKNIGILPVAASSLVLPLLMASYALRLSPTMLLAALLQLVAALFIAAVAGNMMSILFPYRVQPGSTKPTKQPGLAMLMLGLVQFFLPVALLPVFIPPLAAFLWERSGGPMAPLVNAGLSALLAFAALTLYGATLPALGGLLSRRETRILATVSVDVE